jgi:hypothetical protein
VNDLTKGPWYVRHCDDERHMNMTVVSTKDYGDTNDSQYAGERDTVAIVYHQGEPLVMGRFDSDTDVDDRDEVAALIAAAPALRDTMRKLLEELRAQTEAMKYVDWTIVSDAVNALVAAENRS